MNEYKLTVFDKVKQYGKKFTIEYYVDIPYGTVETGRYGVTRVKDSFDVYFTMETITLLNSDPDNIGDFTNKFSIEPIVKQTIEMKFGWDVESDDYHNNPIFVANRKAGGDFAFHEDGYSVSFDEVKTCHWGYKWSLKSAKTIRMY